MKKLFYILLISLFGVSCEKENSDVFVPYPANPLNDTAWTATEPGATAFVNQLTDLFSAPPRIDSFIAANGDTIRLPNDCQVIIPVSCFNFINGTPATGKILLEITHLRTKGDFIRFARPTTSFNKLLESGGAVYIRAFREGQELAVAPNKGIRVRLQNANPLNIMKVFYGETNANQSAAFTWVQSADSSLVSVAQWRDSTGSTVTGYEMFSKRLRWVNCDYFIDSTQPRTRINALLPPNFTNANTSVYAVFKEQKIVVRLTGEFTSRSFFTINMPLNKNIILVSISKIGDDLFLANTNALVVPNLTTHLAPERKTKQQIAQYLDAL